MNTFESKIEKLGDVSLPRFSGLRIMMMPFKLENLDTLPFVGWKDTVAALVAFSNCKEGTAYLTIDEAVVGAGETHRRPGLHVDGMGGWGGGGGGWGANGMITASNIVGCRGWAKTFLGLPDENGSCAHLDAQCPNNEAMVFHPFSAYWCSPMAVHEAIPVLETVDRQFVRLSMPSDAPWYEGYTPNPLGVLPTGPIYEPRTSFMAFRSTGG